MTTYTFTTLDAGVIGGSGARGINDLGQIVGSFTDKSNNLPHPIDHGYLYSGGTYTILNDPLATGDTVAEDINKAGQIVGWYRDIAYSEVHGFLYSNGAYITLDYPGALLTSLWGINNAGQIVGNYLDNSNVGHGFLYSNGTYITLDDPLANHPFGTQAYGINDAGQIVGGYVDSSNTWHGFLYSNGKYTTIDNPLAPHGTTDFAQGTTLLGINDAGQIVGEYIEIGNNGTTILQHGFVYSWGTFTPIDDPLGTNGYASGINDTGQIVGLYLDSNGKGHGFLANPSQSPTQTIENDYFAITRTALPLDQATAITNSINVGTQTETQYVIGLLSQAWNTTIPAVAVEATMYGATGTSAEITALVVNFLPAQVANANQNGLNPIVYSCEALGLVFAFGNETNSTAFANNFGPSNNAMPNTVAGDAAFAAAACATIFGAASTANLASVMQNFVANWEAFYTAHGIPGFANVTAAQIDLAARGAAWGDMVGVALANNLGPLSEQVHNFLADAAQGIAVYEASLIGQPAHQPFQG